MRPPDPPRCPDCGDTAGNHSPKCASRTRGAVEKKMVRAHNVKVGDYVRIPHTAISGKVLDVYPGHDAEVLMTVKVHATIDARTTVEIIEVDDT